MSTIGIASSVLVSVAFITIFTIIGSQVLNILPKFVVDSFKYILPALFGAVYIEMSRKNLRAGLMTIILGVVLMVVANAIKFNAGLMTIVIVACGIIVSRILFVIDKKRKTD
jgi:predicted branched-subunit amino acid permease